MSPYSAAFLIGVVAGLRSMTAPAAVSGAARFGILHLENTWLSFFSATVTAYLFGIFAIGELIVDKLPMTPSRKAPLGFIARIVSGAVSGAAFGLQNEELLAGLVAGTLGAIAGTLAGYEFRTRFTKAAGGHGLTVALLEDALAVAMSVFLVSRFS